MPIVNSDHLFNFVVNFSSRTSFWIFVLVWFFQLLSLGIKERYIKNVMNYPLHRLRYLYSHYLLLPPLISTLTLFTYDINNYKESLEYSGEKWSLDSEALVMILTYILFSTIVFQQNEKVIVKAAYVMLADDPFHYLCCY